MKVQIHENTLKIKKENGDVIKTIVTESYVIYPSEGMTLRNKLTGYTTDSFIGVGSKEEVENYEEI